MIIHTGRTFRTPDNIADLPEAEPLVDPERHRAALFLRERSQLASYALEGIGTRRFGIRWRPLVRVVEGDVEMDFAASLLSAGGGASRIQGDREKPGPEAAIAPVTFEALESPNEHVLGDVESLIGIGQPASRKAIYGIAMQADELAKRLTVSTSGPFYQTVLIHLNHKMPRPTKMLNRGGWAERLSADHLLLLNSPHPIYPKPDRVCTTLGKERRMGGRGAALVILVAGASLAPRALNAQVVAERALLTPVAATSETFQIYIAFPENSFVLGGMIRFPVTSDVDIGGRAGLWAIDDVSDTPYAGADLRYGLLSRALSSAGALNLSFNVGIGVSEPGPTVWKVPLGFIAGIGFGPKGETIELYGHPRVELGFSSGADASDSALLLDFGALFNISPPLAAMAALRFGDGVFDEGDHAVFALSAFWRL